MDLVLLLSLSPGLLLVREQPTFGYSWLFTVTGLLLIRLFCDGLFTRRPRLEPNLNAAGLAFLGVASFVLLMTKAITEPPPASTLETVRRSSELLSGRDPSAIEDSAEAGPVAPMVAVPVTAVSSAAVASGNESLLVPAETRDVLAAKMLAVLSHFSVIAALFFIGRHHFNDTQSGVAMATIYLLLPCTSYDVGNVNHVLPAALIAWAFVFYTRPMIAGSLMGMACGTLFFPVFLLPLWASFYSRRGRVRFCLALILIAAVVMARFAIVPSEQGAVVLSSIPKSVYEQTTNAISLSIIPILSQNGDATGFWNPQNAVYLIPVFVAYLVILLLLTIFPRKKTMEHLMAHSTALIVGIQFWYPREGGIYLLWYLPLLLMVAMRPRLAHLGPPDQQAANEVTRNTSQATQREPETSGTVPGSRLFR
ncbi:MAG: hypothetical protein IH899_08910 [Planctomycetes bacterium]|nr:hypothetical protein [Planctomycetota bacterium]